VAIPDASARAFASLIEPISPPTAAALRNYGQIPGLF
jgi:hypothetical protein